MVEFFQAGQAIESLRESEFDSNSAFGEVIDNSLQADATNINIKFETEQIKSRSNILAIAFGDDGRGMDAATLHNCMTLGWSSRYNDREGIGRFGVGMTLGAIHECKRVEIWSKQAGGEWQFTYLDLDEIKNGALKSIPDPVKRALPKEFASLPGKEHGTLVVWRKVDRQQDDATNIIESFNVWCGRTFRYFIWEAIPPRTVPATITINGEIVPAIDPLYARTEKTRFPKDPPAHVYDPIDIDWVVDTTSPGFEEGRKSKVVIRMSRLDESLRRKQGSGGGPEAKARFIDMNNGISILRSHREVFYGEIPYWKTKAGWANFEEIDRWWGCEVLFDPEIDRAFQVKNIKRGAVPTRNLKEAIKDKILPTRETILQEVRALWSRTKDEEEHEKEIEKGKKLLARAGEHDVAEGTAKKTSVPKNQLDADKDLEKESEAAAKKYADRYNEEEQQRLAELFRSQPFTIMQNRWRGQQFFDSKFLGGSAVLDYNMDHAFWETVYGLVDQLTDEEVDHAVTAKEIRVMLDLLIIAYAKAEAVFSPESEYTADQFVQHLRVNWGQMLNSFVTARKKEKGGT